MPASLCEQATVATARTAALNQALTLIFMLQLLRPCLVQSVYRPGDPAEADLRRRPVRLKRDTTRRYNRGTSTVKTQPSLLSHVAAAFAMAALALAWSFPLAAVIPTHLAGGGFSDNANFLWNFWWMREALGSGERFFSTPYLFAPYGTDLTLHTHTALNAFAGATLFGGVSPLAALNSTILLSLFLNGFCAYLLAWRITRDTSAALIAGLVFGGSP